MTAPKVKVLLVDDDSAMLRLMGKWLEADGYEVQRAGDGRQAQAAIQADCPQLLVTDWEMPYLDGLDLCRWLRQQKLRNYVHAIIVTARSSSDDMVRGLEAGADDFLKKPVDKGELLARLRAGARVLELERRLSQMAKLDPLTGLATQRTFNDELAREWARVQRYHFSLACVMLDLDFFSRVNAAHGLAVGDEVIRRVAAIVQVSCRGSDLVSRYGGEEFCVMLPETTEHNATLWAERVRARLAAERICVDGKEFSITASFGVAERLADTQSSAEVVDLAEQAMLVAKQSGRDRVVSYQSINASAGLRSAAAHVGSLFGDLQARDAMSALVACLEEHQTVGMAVDFFLRFRLSSAPVVDREGRLVGILSEKDALSVLLWPDWRNTKITDVMKRNVVSYAEDTSVLTIYEFLCRVAIRGVVIVKDGRPTGMLGRGSVLRWFLNRGQGNANAENNGAAGDCAVRKQLASIAARLASEARRLEMRLRSHAGELVPTVVSGASRMQELANDLLAASRYAEATLESPPPPEPVASVAAPANLETARLADCISNSALEENEAVWFPPGCEPELTPAQQA